MIVVSFRCESLSPLLMNNPAGMLKARAAGKGRTNVKHIPEPDVEAEDGTYRLPDGTLYFPTLAFRRTAIDAGKGRRIGKVAASGVMTGSLFIAGDHLETVLLDPKTDDPLDAYEVDVRRAVPPGQGAVIRARPRVDSWAAVVSFELDDERVPAELLEELFRLGGNAVGIGNYRPQKGGVYGRFTVERL
jgi:hypothetical protein